MSHLFFVDDILLFIRLSHLEALFMKNVLETFGLETSQRVNKRKTLIWFWINTLGYVWGSICLNFSIASTNFFGMYLGVPILH